MSDDTRNGTTQVVPPAAGDAALILAAVKELLPPAAAEELASWSRGERTASATVERLKVLSRGDTPPAPEWKLGPSVEELTLQLLNLEEHGPPLDLDARLADCRWLQAYWESPDRRQYQGMHLAVLNGQIVGTAREDWLRLQLDLARKFGVHPEQILIDYVSPPTIRLG